MNSPLPIRFTVLSALSIFAALSQQARAEETEVSPARQLFMDARKLMAEGKYAEACPKLQESLQLELGVGTQFNLADCWEHIGKTASARTLFLGAAAIAKSAGQADREQVLRERAAALEPRLSRLVIEVAGAEPKLSVKRNDLPLDAEALGKAEVVDPGKYKIVARAPGKKPWEQLVEVKAGVPITTVEVPELEPAEPVEPPMPSKAPGAGEQRKLPVRETAPAVAVDLKDRSSPHYGAWAVAGVGVAATGVGAIMGAKYLRSNGEAKDVCPSGSGCTVREIQEHDRLVDDARTYRRWSYVGFIGGGAMLVGAGVLWLVERPTTTKTATVSWDAAPVVGVDGTVGAFVNGRF